MTVTQIGGHVANQTIVAGNSVESTGAGHNLISLSHFSNTAIPAEISMCHSTYVYLHWALHLVL